MKDLFVEQHRELYRQALSALESSGVEYMLGGAFAVYYYTGWWRDTHDIDIYVMPEHLDEAIRALEEADFTDLGEQAGGDRAWIYHSGREALIVDVIFRFANLSNYVTSNWLERAPDTQFLGTNMKILPLEELIWLKVFVINRDRSDWPDVMRIIKAQCSQIDWTRLLELLGEHWLLLAGLIDVFDWQHPDSMGCIPDEIRNGLAERRKDYNKHPVKVEREHLLDPWLHQRTDRYAAWSNEQSDDRHSRGDKPFL